MSAESFEPEVSVIMTVYNSAAYLDFAIGSIVSQSLTHWELVIVDDGSDDESPQLLANWQQLDERVKVLSPGRVGRGPALNLAWRYARAPLIANLDADDIAEPDRLRRQLEFMMLNKDVGLVGADCWMLNDQGKRNRVRFPTSDAELRRSLTRNMPFQHSCMMVRKGVLEEVSGYDESRVADFDYDFFIRVAGCHKCASLPVPLIVKRVGGHAYFQLRQRTIRRIPVMVSLRLSAWRHLDRPYWELGWVILLPPFLWLRRAIRYRITDWLRRS